MPDRWAVMLAPLYVIMRRPMLFTQYFPGRIARTFAGVTLAVICAWLFVAGVDAPAVGDALGGVTWWLLVPAVLFGCWNLWLRAARWGVLLAPKTPLPTSQLLGVGLTAGLAGLVLPARGGDVLKLALAARLPQVSLANVAAAEVLERGVDGVVFGSFITGSAVITGDGSWLLALGLIGLALHLPVFLLLPLTGRLAARWTDGSEAAATRSPLKRMLGQSLMAAQQTGTGGLAHATKLSVLAWIAQAVACYFLLVAFGWLAPPALPFATVGVANFAFGLPGAPAGLGTVQFPVRHLLDQFGAEPGMASAYAVVMHLAMLAPLPLLWLTMAAASRRSSSRQI